MRALVLRVMAAALLATGAAPLLRAPQAAADGGFHLLARADVASVAVVDPDAPAVPEGQIAYLSPGTTQAVLDSLGSSEAIASAPYPGDAVANLPPTLNGVLGGKAPSLPDYPFIVSSSHPTRPSAAQDIGPYHLEAASDGQGSSALARLGVSAGDAVLGRAEPSSRVSRKDGTGVAVARATVSGITVGSVLRIGTVTAEASIRTPADGAAERASSLRIDGMTVAGVAVTLTDKGLSVGSSVVPVPGTPAVDQVLQQAGITVKYLPASTTDTDVTSAALAITSHTAVPGRSPVTVTLTLGGVRVASTTLPGELPAVGTGDVTAPLPGPAPADAIGDATGPTPTGAGPVFDAGAAASPGAVGDAPAPQDATVTTPEPAPTGTAAPRPATRVVAGPQGDARGFYLALVAAGVALLVGSRLLGALAVQLRRLPRRP